MHRIAFDAPVPLLVAPDPPLLKPADVAKLPQGPVQFGLARHGQIGPCPSPGIDLAQGALAGALQGIGQSACPQLPTRLPDRRHAG